MVCPVSGFAPAGSFALNLSAMSSALPSPRLRLTASNAWYAVVAPLYASMVARFHLCLASLITSTWCSVWRKLWLGSFLALALSSLDGLRFFCAR